MAACALNWSSYCSVAADAEDRLSSFVGSTGDALAAGAFSERPAARDAHTSLASFARSGVKIPKGLSTPAGCRFMSGAALATGALSELPAARDAQLT